MNIQEIKAGMTQGEWDCQPMTGRMSINGQLIDVWNSNDLSENRGGNYKANAAAICLAVNNTFGQNINPEKVPYMVNMLEGLSTEPKLYPHERYAIEQFLESIKL